MLFGSLFFCLFVLRIELLRVDAAGPEQGVELFLHPAEVAEQLVVVVAHHGVDEDRCQCGEAYDAEQQYDEAEEQFGGPDGPEG